MTSPQPEINEQDAALWAEETKTVRKTEQPEEPPAAPIYLNEITPSVSYKNIPNYYRLPYLKTGDLSAMDGQFAKRVKRCEYKIEATLDLHGKTENIAYEAVLNFIKQSYLQGCRWVLIITGKGVPQSEEDIFSSRGKLKERTPIWLNSEELRPLILGFIHPLEHLGGSGALYIILRKNK